MTRSNRIPIPVVTMILVAASFFLPAWSGSPTVLLIDLDDAIQPVTADFILAAIAEAETTGAELLLLKLETPGGLVSSTEDIVEGILRSEVPVLVFVGGTKAASAGFFITIASHIAVMAPATRIGAAHPVSLIGSSSKEDEVMSEKIVNDLAAYARTIAENRGRNVELAELAVRESRSYTEKEALEEGLIDYILADVEQIIRELDGKEVRTENGQEHRLQLAGADLVTMEMNLRQEILSAISDPSVSIFLIGIGILGLYLEFSNPGLILPGVIGGICLLLFAFSVQILPINYIGLLLIVMGILLFILEIKVVSYGMLSVGGLVCFVFGSLILFEKPPENLGLRVPLEIIFSVSFTVALLMFFLTRLVVSAHRDRVRTGSAGLLGENGTSITEIQEEGKVFVHGEYWNARSRRPIPRGKKVRVVQLENLVLLVEEIAPPS